MTTQAGQSMARCVNPVTHDVRYQPRPGYVVPSLFYSSCSAIRRAVTIRRFNKISTLPLPRSLQQTLGALCMNDFRIDPNEVVANHHRNWTFPATCHIDGTRVMIKLGPKGSELVQYPRIIARFACSGVCSQVLEITQTLAEYMKSNSQKDEPLEERAIWKIIFAIACALEGLQADSNVTPANLHLQEDHSIFYQATPEGTRDVNNMMESAVFYEAPEILTRHNATSRSHSWLLGCIAYELASKKPAYYDRAGNGNLLSVVMSISHGVQPPAVAKSYSADLKHQLISACLRVMPNSRPSVLHIKELAESKLRE